MDFVSYIVEAVNSAVDTILAAGVPVLLSYALYVAFKLRNELVQALPDFLKVLFASLTDAYIERKVVEAVNYAEEYGARVAKESGEKVAVAAEEKLTAALDYLFDLPLIRRLVSEERAVQLIEAILPQLGLGASQAIGAGTEEVVDAIKGIPPVPEAGL